MEKIQNLLPGEDLIGLLGRSYVQSASGNYHRFTQIIGISGRQHIPASFFSPNLKKLVGLTGQTPETLHSEHMYYNYLKVGVPGTLLNKFHRDGRPIQYLNSRDLTAHSWRWCPECVDEDVECYGISYYRRNHQLPGVKVCDKHGSYLISRCTNCNFEAKYLHQMPIPPVNHRCIRCHEKFESDMPYFTSQMKIVQDICVEMANGTLVLTPSDWLPKVHKHLGLSPQDVELGIPGAKSRELYRDITDFYETCELQEYANYVVIRKSGPYCSILNSPHFIYPTTVSAPPHPLAIALLWVFLLEKEAFKQAA